MGFNDLDDLSEFGEEFALKKDENETEQETFVADVDEVLAQEEYIEEQRVEEEPKEVEEVEEVYEEEPEEIEEVEEVYEEEPEEIEEAEEVYEEEPEEVEEAEEVYEEEPKEVEEVEEVYEEEPEEIEEVEEVYEEEPEEVEEAEEVYEEEPEEVEEAEEVYEEEKEEVDYEPVGFASGVIDDESACVAVSTIDERQPFKDRLKGLGEEIIAYHKELQAFLISYQGVKSRYSIRCDSYRVHRELLAKMAIGGKTLKLYLAVSPDEEFDIKINQRDLSDKRAYEEVPFMIPIRSQLSVRKAKKIIVHMMAELNIKSKFKR